MSVQLEAGTILARSYRLLRPIGEGGMGRIWVAEHMALAREVAIKVISEEALQTPMARELFVREAKATARADNPHVVRVLDFEFTDDGFPFLVLERLIGETLEERIARTGPLSLGETSTLVEHIGSAVSAAHACGIVHRDIKAENIFLVHTRDGKIDARLLDFGVAISKNARPLIVGTVGTAQYMSPEQLTGAAVDERSDLFSLGICVYYALTAILPFDGKTLSEVALALSQTCASVSAHRPTLPRSLDAWFIRALARDPEGRFKNAREMSDAFKNVSSGRATERRTPLSLEVDVKPERPAGVPRRRGMETFVVAGVILGCVAVAMFRPARHALAARAMVSDEIANVERISPPLALFEYAPIATQAPPPATSSSSSIAPATSAAPPHIAPMRARIVAKKNIASSTQTNDDIAGFGGRE